MNDPINESSSKHDSPARQQRGGEPLTDAQREFAKLLGRLLAQRWQEEQRGREMTDRCES
jgi:hypothetical protein